MSDTRSAPRYEQPSALSPGRGHIDLTPGAESGSNARTMLLVIYGLFFAGFITSGVTTVLGLVMAYIGRGFAPAWAESHYSFQIRTFWLLLLGIVLLSVFALVSTVLIIVLIGLPMLLVAGLGGAALAVWYGLRCAIGFNHVLNSRPYPNPGALIV